MSSDNKKRLNSLCLGRFVFELICVSALSSAMTSCFSTSTNNQTTDLPIVVPAFKATSMKRVKPIFKVFEGSKGDNPVLICGNKRLAVREQNDWRQKIVYNYDRPNFFTVIINNQQALKGSFVGHAVDMKNYGHPFDPKEKGFLSYDKKSRSITFTKKYTYAKGKTARYKHTFQILDDGTIKVSWDLGLDAKTLASFKRNRFYFVPTLFIDQKYLDTGFDYKGEPVRLLDAASFAKTKKDPKHRSVSIASGPGGTISFAPKNALEGFKLIFDKSQKIDILEGYGRYQNGHRKLQVSIGNQIKSSTGSFLIDLGETAILADDTPPPVRGTDDWKIDRSHIPLTPTVNIMPNPSFEQGTRYWRSYSLGANFRWKQVDGESLYDFSDDAKFGKSSLKINSGKVPLNTFSIPVEKGKTYTISYYAKCLSKKGGHMQLSSGSSIQSGDWLKWKTRNQKVTSNWERYSYQYKATSKAMCLILRSYTPVLLDGIQIEEGDKPTPFVAPPVEGNLLTSAKDNVLMLGEKIDARFKLIGVSGVKGRVKLDVMDYYRKKVYTVTKNFVLDQDGLKTLPVNLDAKKLGKGVFIVKATYTLPGSEPFFDYYRFAIIDPLHNTHATKNLFATLPDFTRTTRSADLAKRFQQCGWGSLGSGRVPIDYLKKYNFTWFWRPIQSKYSLHFSKPPFPWYGIWRGWTCSTPEREKYLEKLVYNAVKALPEYDHLETAVAGEVECRQKMVMAGKYDDYVKLMLAARRGAKRANKNVIFLPNQGTSGFNPLRGYRETEAMLKSTYKLAPKGFKWDALAAHPYGDVDMIDERTEFFKKIASKYGEDDVPLQYTECFNIADNYIPSWGAQMWQDAYWNGRPTYDTGWAEFRQAAWAARVYIVSLKHWPRLEHVNIWVNKPYIDEVLTPTMLCGAVNTLGHLFGNPKFVADIRPVEGIRSYVFEDAKKRGLVAVWSTISEVDRGYEVPPKLKIKIDGELPEIIDLMGNKRKYAAVDGEIIIPLSSAPIFVRGGTAEELKRAFGNAQVIGSNRAVKTIILPVLRGQIDATIANQTSQTLSGKLIVDSDAQSFSLKKSPDKVTLIVKKPGAIKNGKLYSWNKGVKIDLSNGGSMEEKSNLQYFYVAKTAKPLPLNPDAPEWNKISAINITNKHFSKDGTNENAHTGEPGDSSASYQMAWDKNNLYLKVTLKDDELMKPAEKWLHYPKSKRNQMLYMNDSALEVYIDTGANGRSNAIKGYDDDDYRYDFYGNGPEGIYRRHEVNQQLAGGVDFLSKKGAAQAIKNKFVRRGNKASYVIIFPQVTIEPLRLSPGFQAGFGLYIHDVDKNDRHGLTTATQKGAHCNYRPDLWPIMVLSEQE